jgi:hypothetical protein
MANIIPASTQMVQSKPFKLKALIPTTLSISTEETGSSVPAGAYAAVQLQSAKGTFMTVATIDQKTPMLVLAATGMFRVVKSECASPFGIERD